MCQVLPWVGTLGRRSSKAPWDLAWTGLLAGKEMRSESQMDNKWLKQPRDIGHVLSVLTTASEWKGP